MKGSNKPPNRTWGALAGLVSLILVVALAALQPSADHTRETLPSSFFSNDSGGKAAYLVLREFFPVVERWRHGPGLLILQDEQPPVDTMIVMGPERHLTPAQAEALDNWVSSGGRLIVAADQPWPVRTPDRLFELSSRPGETEKSGAEESPPPDYLSRHGFNILAGNATDPESPLHVEAGHLEEGDYTTLASGPEGATAASRQLGDGLLVVIADALAFSNLRLREHPRNMTFLVHLLENLDARRIALDEYHHGFEGQRPFLAVVGGFLSTAWGLACLQLAAAGLLYLLGTRARFGAIQETAPAPERDPLVLVEARAGLLREAEARALAVQAIDRHRQRRQSRGLAVPAHDPAVDPVAPEYRQILATADRGGSLADADVLRFARLAEEQTRRLP